MTWDPPRCGSIDARGGACVLPAGHVGGHAGADQLGLSRWHGTGKFSLWGVLAFVALILLAAAALDALGFAGQPVR